MLDVFRASNAWSKVRLKYLEASKQEKKGLLYVFEEYMTQRKVRRRRLALVN